MIIPMIALKHKLDIHYDYWMGRVPVTNELYSMYVTDRGLEHPVFNWREKTVHPVTEVTWYDAVDYCKWLTELFKSELPSGYFLRLPSEAEWEKSARGRDGGRYRWGNKYDETIFSRKVRIAGKTTPVRFYSPRGDSPYGCADMVTNVYEWTCSMHRPYPANIKNIMGEAKNDDLLIQRGGVWQEETSYGLVVNRFHDHPNYRGDNIGFRVAVAPIII